MEPSGSEEVRARRRLGVRPALAAGALYALATVVLTWPLFRRPASTVLDAYSLYGGAGTLIQRDINLILWLLAWDTHALVTHPLRLFHANTFHPAPYTLALTEHMLGYVPVFGPIYLGTANPVLAHQLTLLFNFAVAGVAMAACILYWTRDRATALAAGFLYAFAPARMWQLGALNMISTQYLPLVPLGIDATLDHRTGRGGPATVGLALLFSCLSSYYVGYAAFVLAAAYLPAALVVRGRATWGRLPILFATVAAVAAAVGALSIPYLLLQQRGILPDFDRSGFVSLAFLAMLKFGAPGMLSFYVLPRRDGIPNFVTWTALALAALALVLWRRPPRGALLAVALTGIVLGLGPQLVTPWVRPLPLPYWGLARIVPGFSAMRAPQRFGVIVTLAAISLAALGLAAVRARLRAAGWSRIGSALPCLVIAAGLFEAVPRGLGTVAVPVGEAVPPAYRWLAAHDDGGPLLELPASRNDLWQQSRYVYFSTVHWLPLVNGYAAYPPHPYSEVMRAAEQLPDPAALQAALAAVRPRWILVHRDAIAPASRSAWEATFAAALRPVRDFGDAILYEVPRHAVSDDPGRRSAFAFARSSLYSTRRCRRRG